MMRRNLLAPVPPEPIRQYEAQTMNAAADLCEAIEALRSAAPGEIVIRWSRDGEGNLDILCPPQLDRCRDAIEEMIAADRAMGERFP